MQQRLEIGKRYKIHSYKHDGTMHRTWNEAILLEEHDDYLVFANSNSRVQEEDGAVWYTHEIATMVFYKKKWFNIIIQYKDQGVTYYCNISSPYIFEDDTIKYIDYDLDLRVFPNGRYKVLDLKEYQENKKKYNYSKELDKILRVELKELIKLAKNKNDPFNIEIAEEYYNEYMNILM